MSTISTPPILMGRTSGDLQQTNTLPAQSQDQFHRFSKLPTELRLRIWNFNLPPPRIVPIRCGAESLSFSSHAHSPPPQRQWPSTNGCTSYAAVPVNLHVCHESRAEALKLYRLSFGMTRNPGQIFFDNRCDVLYFGARDGYMASEAQFLTVMALCDPADLAEVRHLAINDSLFWVNSCYQSMSAANLTVEVLKQVQSRMPKLERLLFIPRDENPVYDTEAVLVEPNHGDLEKQMARQMGTAMRGVCHMFPNWTPPRWSITALGAGRPEDNWRVMEAPDVERKGLLDVARCAARGKETCCLPYEIADDVEEYVRSY
ncbi:hypothetical protein C8035_v011933 [Colletotrichum spinosum]|uniref:2EXR domain-containing protein n=1 Tax=Colletotrichum spinosum TaxID=1347390 RepID=A0A4R8PND6_9PEZI|nr:hypothetical protein C8035_v011933 [Colletotrichum spinosum]